MAFLPISRSRFKQRLIPLLISLTTVWQFCVNFWVIFGHFAGKRYFLWKDRLNWRQCEMLKIWWIWKIENWNEELVDGHQTVPYLPGALFWRGQLSGSVSNQEIIKVREWIHHIGPLTKVIPLKLFLDVVSSSSANITRTLRGQPKRLSRNYRRQNGGNVIVYVLISFHSRNVPCTLSRLFVRPGFRLFCVRLAIHYLAVYSILES